MAAPITIKVDTSTVLSALRQISADDAPFLTAYALTRTGQDIKTAQYNMMRAVFDRPTKFTLNSLQLQPATKTELSAVIDYKYFGGTPADRYLGPEVEGGPRRHKSHEKALISAGLMRSDEFAVPGKGVTLDAYGNMRGADLTRILSQLMASSDPMQNMTDRSRKRALKSAGGRYFVMRGRGAPDGVYLRRPDGIMPVLVFVRAPRYTPRFPFYDVARTVFDQQFLGHGREGFDKFIVAKYRKAA